MAKHKSTPRTRLRRNGVSSVGQTGHEELSELELDEDVGPESPREILESAVGKERERLMDTHSVLGCVLQAIAYEDGAKTHALNYASTLVLVQEQIDKAIRGLDSDAIESMVEAMEIESMAKAMEVSTKAGKRRPARNRK